MDNNSKLAERLNKYFNGNIKLTFVSQSEFIIISKDDKLYKFKNDDQMMVFLALSEDNSIIESMMVKELCGKGIINFSCGEKHAFAWNKQQQIYCWGRNGCGQLGNGRKDIYLDDEKEDMNFNKPELNENLSEKNIVDIKCGFEHSLALSETGEVYSWGWNRKGQIGCETSDYYQLIPIKVNGFDGEKVKEISCGSYYSMALTESGRVFSWGWSENGMLGYRNTKMLKTPQLIKVENENETDVIVKKISCGRKHILLLTSEGDIYTFGDNEWGQIGNDSDVIQCNPLKLNISSKKFIDIASHIQYNISIAISESGIYYIWGQQSKERSIRIPKDTNFEEVNDIFITLFGITYKPLESNNGFLIWNRNFTENGKYQKEYEEIEKLGEGSYGTVFKVKDINNRISAMKKMEIKIENANELMKEFQISSNLKFNSISEYVVIFHSSWFENDYRANNVLKKEKLLLLHIEMEICDKTLQDLIDEIEEDSCLLENETLTSIGYFIASQLFVEMLRGVEYLHEQTPPLIHRDLKPENILLKQGKKGSFVKIADFGLATIHEFAEKLHDKDMGTPKFTAPEVIYGKSYDTKADIFSLGVIMQRLFNLFDYDRIYDVDDSSVLMTKYQRANNFYKEMTNDCSLKRPDCKKLIEQKHLWCLAGEELDFESFKSFLHTNNSYLNFIIESKLFDSTSVGYLLKKKYGFCINNSSLLSISHFCHRIELCQMYELWDKGIIDIVNSWHHIIGLTNAGQVYCWNSDIAGWHLITFNFNPELNACLNEKIIVQIKCGRSHSLALTKCGEVYAWGSNSSGCLGIGKDHDIDCDFTPIKVNGFDDKKVIMISCGLHFSMVLTECGNVYSWGVNDYGQLGLGFNSNSSESISKKNQCITIQQTGRSQFTPKRVKISNVRIKKISCGSTHSLLLSIYGDIYVFGNSFGQRGNEDDMIPRKLRHKNKFIDIRSHSFHHFSAALSETGIYYVWGDFDEQVILKPEETDFHTFDEIYEKCFERKIGYNNI